MKGSFMDIYKFFNIVDIFYYIELPITIIYLFEVNACTWMRANG